MLTDGGDGCGVELPGTGPDANGDRATFVQLDLFEESTRRLMRARYALFDFDLKLARSEFETILAQQPTDRDAERGFTRASIHLDRLAELEANHVNSVDALFLLEPHVEEQEQRGWYRSIAREAARLYGEGSTVRGEPVGLYWFLGGAFVEAERSLRVSLGKRPNNARARSILGDVFFKRNDVVRARAEHLFALLSDAKAVDLERLSDPSILALLPVIKHEYEIADDPESWIPATGTVEGLFPWPHAPLPGLSDTLSIDLKNDSPGIEFYRALLRDRTPLSHEERIMNRRRMKGLCPLLFAAYLERLVLV